MFSHNDFRLMKAHKVKQAELQHAADMERMAAELRTPFSAAMTKRVGGFLMHLWHLVHHTTTTTLPNGDDTTPTAGKIRIAH